MDNSINNVNKITMPIATGIMDKKSQNPQYKKEEDVEVTNHMGKLAGLLAANDEVVNPKVAELQQRINTNDYRVDLNVLSDKLLNSGILNPLGE